MRNIILKSSGILLFLFGLFDIFFSVSTIYDLFQLGKAESNPVFLMAIADLVCGVIYLCAGYGFFKEKIWTTKFLFSAAFILIFTFIIIIIYTFSGGNYEEKVFIAIPVRTFITLVFTLLSWNFITKKVNFPGSRFE